MIILLIALWSLSAIYFTHLLFKKRMKIAAGFLALLYIYVLLWVYLLFIIDVGGVGFHLTVLRGNSILYGDVYRAFNAISVQMSSLSDQFLVSIIMIAILIAFSSILVVLDGTVKISIVIRNRIRKTVVRDLVINSSRNSNCCLKPSHNIFETTPLIKMHCRANC